MLRVASERKGLRLEIVKAGRQYKVFTFLGGERGTRLVFVDLRALVGGGSLEKACTSLGVDEYYGLKKSFQPFSFYTSLERVHGQEVPSYFGPYFRKMNSSKKICTSAEYKRFVRRLQTSTHLDLFREYMELDTKVTLLCFLECCSTYRDLFGISVLDARSFTSSSLFYRQCSVINPFLAAQPGFCRMEFSTALAVVLGGMSGGLCVRMVDFMRAGDPLFPQAGSYGAGKTCRGIASLDFRWVCKIKAAETPQSKLSPRAQLSLPVDLLPERQSPAHRRVRRLQRGRD